MHEIKTFPFVDFKVTGDGAGTFSGRASTFDTVDSYGDTIRKGAYEKTLPDFMKRGFVAWAHDWTNPIAMPVAVEERADGLYVEAKFHSDSQAQMYRTRVKERVDAGQFMGLSIGYTPTVWHMEDETRVLDEIKLYEISLVTVPAEENSGLITVKGHGLTFEAHSEQLRVALEEFEARCKAGSALREEKVGRAISATRAAIITGVSGSLRSHADALDSMVSAPEPDDDDEGEPDPVVGLAAGVDPELKRVADKFASLFQHY